jgi:hypothetical protein
MSNIFAELQMLANTAETSVADARKKMNEIVAVFKKLPGHATYLEYFANERKGIRPETFEAADSFFVDEEYPVTLLPEELRHDSLGFVNGYGYVFNGRFVYPVKDCKGDVAGWCGYDKFVAPKYLDSTNYGYKPKESILYGMERIKDYYEDTGPVFVTEGIVCALWLRQEGFSALALLGSYMSPYVMTVLNRFGNRCIVIPDADEAGNKLAKQVRYNLKQAKILQSRKAKDIDDTQKICPDLKSELLKYNSLFGNSDYFKRGGAL